MPAGFHGNIILMYGYIVLAEVTLDRLDRFDSEQDYPTLLDVLELDRTDSKDFVKLEKWSSPGTTKVSTTMVPRSHPTVPLELAPS